MDLNIEDRIESIRLHINKERLQFFGSILEDKVILPKKLKIETDPEVINKSCQKLVDLEYRNKTIKKRTLIGNKSKNNNENTTNNNIENPTNNNNEKTTNNIENTTNNNIENPPNNNENTTTNNNENTTTNNIENPPNNNENTTTNNIENPPNNIENPPNNIEETKPLCNVLYNRPWNKLEKMVKLNRFKDYINNQNEWSNKEKNKAYKTIEKVVEFNYLNKASDVDYDKDVGKINTIKKLNININEKGERKFSIIFT